MNREEDVVEEKIDGGTDTQEDSNQRSSRIRG